ncbi:5'-methylthioadenosine/S-adenosylhomocysteine nucleosidase [Candidatus Providencia siddallii]|uniref:5'-methylthioadenosine/S-adenosylhomocysteine nucleosidase n=1 Tax=Candidatus Providencia siddallii TaxID=1715285 RepID=A0ABM9NNI7_9GAMM
MGIIGAMEQEISFLKTQIKKCNISIYFGYIFYTGKINDINIILIKSGIGKVAVSIATTLVIKKYNPDAIINIGSACSLNNKLQIGDIAVSKEVKYHDVDITLFGYKIGQMAQCPTSFKANKKLIKITMDSISLLKFNSIAGLICTGDSFINDKIIFNKIKKLFPKTIAIEMEAAAIGQVCYKFKIPFIIIRSISDIANEKSKKNFNDFLYFSAQQSSLVITNILNKFNTKYFWYIIKILIFKKKL